MFYQEVIHAVLLFEEETCFFLEEMINNLEGGHRGLLRQVTGNTSKRQRDRTRRNAAAASLLKEAGTQKLGTYIGKHQATVAEWVALRLILGVCDRETGYEGGGSLHEPWWRKMTARKQLIVMSEEILVVARDHRWEYGRGGEGRECGDLADYD